MKFKNIDIEIANNRYSKQVSLTLDISENSNEQKIEFLNEMFSKNYMDVKKKKDVVQLTFDIYDESKISKTEVKEFLENINSTYMIMISTKNQFSEVLSEFFLKYYEFD